MDDMHNSKLALQNTLRQINLSFNGEKTATAIKKDSMLFTNTKMIRERNINSPKLRIPQKKNNLPEVDRDVLERFFYENDTDGDGRLVVEDLYRVAKQSKLTYLTDDLMEDMFQKADMDGEGYLTIFELKKLVAVNLNSPQNLLFRDILSSLYSNVFLAQTEEKEQPKIKAKYELDEDVSYKPDLSLTKPISKTRNVSYRNTRLKNLETTKKYQYNSLRDEPLSVSLECSVLSAAGKKKLKRKVEAEVFEEETIINNKIESSEEEGKILVTFEAQKIFKQMHGL
ncbi:hypothetical protein PCE1_001564 [Barthelona sp. PCE]